MDIYQKVLAVIGGLVLLALFIAVCFGLFEKLVCAFKELMNAIRADARRVSRIEIGRELTSAAHWFGESKEARLVLLEAGRQIENFESCFADSLRDRWREELLKQD